MNNIVKPCVKCVHYIAPQLNKQLTFDGGYGLCRLFQNRTPGIINYKAIDPTKPTPYEYAIVARAKAKTLCGGKYFFEKNKGV